MSDSKAILRANQAFYDAFSRRDLAAMDALWARHAAVACIHPGWNAIAGRETVMESWRSILGNPSAPRIRCFEPSVHQIGDVAFVTCYEAVEQGLLVATNIFAREADAWRIVHHQAGPTAQASSEAAAEPSDTVH